MTGDKKKGHIGKYVGNNYGFGGNDFHGNFNINLPAGGFSVPSGSSAPPPNPPQPPPNTDIDKYVGNNYGFGGNDFDGTYNINIGGGQNGNSTEEPKKPDKPKEPEKPKPKPKEPEKTKPKPKEPEKTKPKPKEPENTKPKTKTKPQPRHTAGRSTYTLPNGGMQTSCPVCERLWARNNSMSNYQALLRGDHIYS